MFKNVNTKKIKIPLHISDKTYLEYLKRETGINCEICEWKQADNVDTIDWDHPCARCIGSCYEADMVYMHPYNNFQPKDSEAGKGSGTSDRLSNPKDRNMLGVRESPRKSEPKCKFVRTYNNIKYCRKGTPHPSEAPFIIICNRTEYCGYTVDENYIERMKKFDEREKDRKPEPKTEFNFPHKTLDWMINEIEERHHYLKGKLLETKKLKDINKKNRWFGYYQFYGEQLMCWTLQDVIDKVSEERDSETGKDLRKGFDSPKTVNDETIPKGDIPRNSELKCKFEVSSKNIKYCGRNTPHPEDVPILCERNNDCGYVKDELYEEFIKSFGDLEASNEEIPEPKINNSIKHSNLKGIEKNHGYNGENVVRGDSKESQKAIEELTINTIPPIKIKKGIIIPEKIEESFVELKTKYITITEVNMDQTEKIEYLQQKISDIKPLINQWTSVVVNGVTGCFHDLYVIKEIENIIKQVQKNDRKRKRRKDEPKIDSYKTKEECDKCWSMTVKEEKRNREEIERLKEQVENKCKFEPKGFAIECHLIIKNKVLEKEIERLNIAIEAWKKDNEKLSGEKLDLTIDRNELQRKIKKALEHDTYNQDFKEPPSLKILSTGTPKQIWRIYNEFFEVMKILREEFLEPKKQLSPDIVSDIMRF